MLVLLQKRSKVTVNQTTVNFNIIIIFELLVAAQGKFRYHHAYGKVSGFNYSEYCQAIFFELVEC